MEQDIDQWHGDRELAAGLFKRQGVQKNRLAAPRWALPTEQPYIWHKGREKVMVATY